MPHIIALTPPIQIRYALAPLTTVNGGSVLGRIIATSKQQKNFTPPIYSNAYLQRVHLILAKRDVEVCRLEQSLTTLPKTSRSAGYPEYYELSPSKRRRLSRSARSVKPTTPLCHVTSVVKQPVEVKPSRCPHDVLCKPGEMYSLICQACRLNFAPWEETRTFISLTPARLNNVDDADLLSGDANLDACIADEANQPAPRFAAPTKKQSAEWNNVFREAKLPAISRDKHTVSLMGDVSSTTGKAVEVGAGNYHHRNEAQVFEAKQQWKQVGVEVGPRCLRCDAPLGSRKGTKYCSDNCRKRHHEEQGQANNLSNNGVAQ